MARKRGDLYLHEEIMLLALRDEKGTVELGSMYGFALGGAILAELLLGKRVAVEEGRKKLINLVSDISLGEPVLDECLRKIATAKRRANPQTWVQRLSSLKNLHHCVAEGLCDRGILRAAEGKVLLIFSRRIYPEINPVPERRLIERLRKTIFGESPQVDPRTAILISLAKSANLLAIPFDKRALKRRKQRIEEIVNANLMGKATADAIEAAQAAIMLACIIPAIAVATVSH